MIRIQPTTSDSNRLLIGSDQADPEVAQSEIDAWILENNCRVPETPRRLSVYEDGKLVREWLLVERCTAAAQEVETPHLFLRLWQRKPNAAAAEGNGETIRLRFDRAA